MKRLFVTLALVVAALSLGGRGAHAAIFLTRAALYHGSLCHSESGSQVNYSINGAQAAAGPMNLLCPLAWNQDAPLANAILATIDVEVRFFNSPTPAPACTLFFDSFNGALTLMSGVGVGGVTLINSPRPIPPSLPVGIAGIQYASLWCQSLPAMTGISGYKTNMCFNATGIPILTSCP